MIFYSLSLCVCLCIEVFNSPHFCSSFFSAVSKEGISLHPPHLDLLPSSPPSSPLVVYHYPQFGLLIACTPKGTLRWNHFIKSKKSKTMITHFRIEFVELPTPPNLSARHESFLWFSINSFLRFSSLSLSWSYWEEDRKNRKILIKN